MDALTLNPVILSDLRTQNELKDYQLRASQPVIMNQNLSAFAQGVNLNQTYKLIPYSASKSL